MARNNVPNMRRWALGIVVVILVIIFFYFPVPYFVSQPGDAVDLSQLVKVEDGYPQEGSIMLTTIKMGKANVISYAWAKVSNYVELIEEKKVLAHLHDQEEYFRYQQKLMDLAKNTAIIAAFNQAGMPVEIINEGVVVMGIDHTRPAASLLKVGDVITHVDQMEIKTVEELREYLNTKPVGQEVTLTLRRGQMEEKATLKLEKLPRTDGEEERVGIGISAITEQTIYTDPPVFIDARKIGGPSAGLMFALQIYNLLDPHDITKGYRIAGTGTIDENGNVGKIGGVHQKVVAAHQAGADIFFAPFEKGAQNSNYEVALKTARELGSSIKVIPVDTLEEALAYLEQLPDKRVRHSDSMNRGGWLISRICASPGSWG